MVFDSQWTNSALVHAHACIGISCLLLKVGGSILDSYPVQQIILVNQINAFFFLHDLAPEYKFSMHIHVLLP